MAARRPTARRTRPLRADALPPALPPTTMSPAQRQPRRLRRAPLQAAARPRDARSRHRQSPVESSVPQALFQILHAVRLFISTSYIPRTAAMVAKSVILTAS